MHSRASLPRPKQPRHTGTWKVALLRLGANAYERTAEPWLHIDMPLALYSNVMRFPQLVQGFVLKKLIVPGTASRTKDSTA